jgi:hypothetical protein
MPVRGKKQHHAPSEFQIRFEDESIITITIDHEPQLRESDLASVENADDV